MFDETLKTSGFYHQIAMFLRSSANDEDIRSGVNRRSAVANARLIGIESCKNALKYQRKMASGQILLASLGRNLQFFWGGAVSKVVQQGVQRQRAHLVKPSVCLVRKHDIPQRSHARTRKTVTTPA